MNKNKENVELILKLKSKLIQLENELDFKRKENQSLKKNLSILESNIRSKKNSFKRDVKQLLRSSDFEKEELRFQNERLKNEVEDLEQEAQNLRSQFENM